MACQASACMARGWNSSKYWLHKGRMVMLGRRGYLLSFWTCMCFILSAITAVGRPGAKVGTWGINNTLSSAPSAEPGEKRHIRSCLRGGPTIARIGPLLFLSDWSGGLLRRRIQGDLGPGSLALREGVVQRVNALYPADPCQVGAQECWRCLRWLLSWRRFRVTASSR